MMMTIRSSSQRQQWICRLLFLLISLLLLLNNNSVVFGNSSSCSSSWHGCSLLLPKDIVYDPQARQALSNLQNQREKKNDDDDEKLLLKECSDENHVTLTLKGYKGGKLEDQINQDRAFIIPTFIIPKAAAEEEDTTTNTTNNPKLLFMGVFDGHGNKGEIVSQYSLDETPKRLASKLESILSIHTNNDSEEEEEKKIKNALRETFLEVDRDIPTGGVGGCTASVMLRVGSKLYIANSGDSISLVAIRTSSSTTKDDDNEAKVIYVSREDKPHLADERARIEAMGGQVYIPKDLENESSRVIFTNPITGSRQGLAMSRSIGDWDMTGAIAEPLVDVVDLTQYLIPSSQSCDDENDEKVCSKEEVQQQHEFFCISATDGMMDYISPQLLANTFASVFLLQKENDNSMLVLTAEELIKQAARGWESQMKGQYRDDIAIAAARIEL